METLAIILLVLIIIVVILLLGSYLFALYQINKIKNKFGNFVEDKAKEMINEKNIKNIGSNILNKIKKRKKDE